MANSDAREELELRAISAIRYSALRQNDRPMPAQCPKCNSQIHNVIADHVDVNVVGGKTWHGISYACPSCSVLLSVAIDPISLKADTVEGTVAAVAQHLHSLEARRQ